MNSSFPSLNLLNVCPLMPCLIRVRAVFLALIFPPQYRTQRKPYNNPRLERVVDTWGPPFNNASEAPERPFMSPQYSACQTIKARNIIHSGYRPLEFVTVTEFEAKAVKVLLFYRY